MRGRGREDEGEDARNEGAVAAGGGVVVDEDGDQGADGDAGGAAQYKLAVGQGVYVESVMADSPAAKCGMQTGDVLLQLGRYRVNSIEDVATLLEDRDAADGRAGAGGAQQYSGAGDHFIKISGLKALPR